ncbi:MAG: ABC transporter permease [Bacteroidetes bacterium HGW-Bacteroidetes-1]|jgi:ABC-2 type transport system permease protein|nr:MAG: ABC transporter permease [Bacteroidetes bacterium HGW-Bacteroidetes-1]
MRTILFILQKEFRQIFRDRTMLPIILVVPMVQLLILSYTATFELKNTRLAIIDQDHSVSSRSLNRKFEGSPFFSMVDGLITYDEGMEMLKRSKADQILVIESDLDYHIGRSEKAGLLLVTNAINGSAASLMNAYALAIINDFGKEVQKEMYPNLPKVMPIHIEVRHWYNPQLDYKTYMVPGILVLLVTLIGMFLSGMNIVKEKEFGTIEQINVTPIKKYQFMIGKLLPFWFIAMFELLFGLGFAALVFNIHIVGSLPLLLGVASVYLLVVLGFGLLVSTITETMQQAMFVSWFFLVIFILMSGLFTPAESMPDWAQWLNRINPIAYFIQINRMIMLKGSSFSDFADQFYALVVYAFVIFSLAVWRYRKVA